MALRAVIACAFLALGLAGCGGGKSASTTTTGSSAKPAPQLATGGPPWPAPKNAVELTKRAGLVPERAEFLQYHVHAHLDIFVNGDPVRVTSGIGINIADPAVKREQLEDGTFAYGGIDPPCKKPCISPLHTHDDSGVIHTESKTPTPNRLGQLFVEWNVKLTPTCVGGYCKPVPIALYVDGKPFIGDPGLIELSDQKEIAIVIGTHPDSIPDKFPAG